MKRLLMLMAMCCLLTTAHAQFGNLIKNKPVKSNATQKSQPAKKVVKSQAKPTQKRSSQSSKPTATRAKQEPTKINQESPRVNQEPTKENQESPRVNQEPLSNRTFTVNGESFIMVGVQGGTFQMGSNTGNDNEEPVHSVTLSSYYIGQTEVTQTLWEAVMGDNPSNSKGYNIPVEQVSWNECQTFITKLNHLTGEHFRLPTEAEWEFAAKGGNKSKRYTYSGSNTIDDVAWYYNNSDYKTHLVARKFPNELGIYDMSGNVSEWCQDWYDSYSSSSQTNPTGPTSGYYCVLRGGGWNLRAEYCRPANRGNTSPDHRSNNCGLRIALSESSQSSRPTASRVHQEPPRVNQEPISVIGAKTFTINGANFTMVPIEGGTFQMGSNNGYNDEKPIHSVTLSSYYIGQTEVTQALWKAVMGSNPSYFSGDNLPVEQVSWNDCQTFITKLNELTGKTFRLPTEAEWEYAARAGSRTSLYNGQEIVTYGANNSPNLDPIAWYGGNCGRNFTTSEGCDVLNGYDISDWPNKQYPDRKGGTHHVGRKQPNAFGLYDMLGNVFEWCQDRYGDYSNNSQTNPTGPKKGSYRVARGGCWVSDAKLCRSAFRVHGKPKNKNSSIGLRLVLSE